MFVWGDSDALVPLPFSRHVREALPGAREELLEECGHVPQVELPELTNALVRQFVGEADASIAARMLNRVRAFA